ncbi:hypothetical protein SASPL_149789 [Salvia splendens]|uniref:Riboflavin synthase n=1 Tax=Salvia splendens TaxID=180675 RepID=A0A8X8Z221_SALSN|nr:hypothetical protein SASPL_149789 [Salvia splendens]
MALSCPPTLLSGPCRNPSTAARTLSITDLSAAAPPRQPQLHSKLVLKQPPLSSIIKKPSKPHHPKLANTTVKSLFTGIVEEMGTIKHLGFDKPDSFSMKIQAKTVLEGVHLGDSIAVNGTCLTVTEFDTISSEFSVGLARRRCGRPLWANWRGHVDGTGEIVELRPEGDSLWVKVKVGREILRYIVPKGFIAVDGTSLTVVDVFDDEGCFNFMLVAYTQQKVVIALKKVGQKVNLEVDILGKYVERLLGSGSVDSFKSS